MRPQTIEALHRLNRDFYRRRAAEFSATRRRPWPGWERALDVYLARRRPGGRILDLGCGNGRLAAFLAPRLGTDHVYIGLDESPPLLAEAAGRASAFARAGLAAADLVADRWPLAARHGGFSWVAAFGLLHHVAGAAGRRRLLARIGRLVAPGGLATVSLWQFAGRRRFLARAVEPRGFGAGELERGDYLLRWGDGDDRRYCHHVDDREAAELASASALELVATYRADGESADLNLYLLLAKAPA